MEGRPTHTTVDSLRQASLTPKDVPLGWKQDSTRHSWVSLGVKTPGDPATCTLSPTAQFGERLLPVSPTHPDPKQAVPPVPLTSLDRPDPWIPFCDLFWALSAALTSAKLGLASSAAPVFLSFLFLTSSSFSLLFPYVIEVFATAAEGEEITEPAFSWGLPLLLFRPHKTGT